MKLRLLITTAILLGAVFIVPNIVFAVDETTVEQIISNEFQGVGIGQGWIADDASYSYDLPFAFPGFYGNDYDTVYVNTNGMICFGGPSSEWSPDLAYTGCGPFVAAYWHDLRPSAFSDPPGDIFIFIEEDINYVVFRWLTSEFGGFGGHTSPYINFEIILYANGDIKFNYGEQTQDLGWGATATVGISKGDGVTYTVSTLDGQSNYNFEQTSFWEANLNEAPTDINISNSTVDENQSTGTEIGTLSTTDQDVGDTHTYSFCGGTDDNSVQLSGNSLETNEVFDFETKNSYDICIRTTDSAGVYFDKNFTITINDIDESAPTPPTPTTTEDLEIDLYSIKNTTTDSVDLRVEVENYLDDELDFKVKVKNIDTGDEFTVKLTEKVSDNGKATLTIDGLESGTRYRFKVKVSEEDEDDYTDYSDSKKATTLEEEVQGAFIPVDYSEPTPTIQAATEPVVEETIIEEPKEQPKPMVKETPARLIGGPGSIPKDLREKYEKEEYALSVAKIAVPLATAAALPLLPLFAIPFIKKKREKYWGVVFNTKTKQPIADIPVSLVDTNSNEILETVITDKTGRYGFLISNQGNYKIDINKQSYSIDTEKENDSIYGNLYTEPQEFNPDTPIELNIALNSPKNKESISRSVLTKKLWSILTTIIFIVGGAYAIHVTIISPHIFNYIVLTIYALVAIYLVITFTKKHYGTITQKETNSPIPFTLVELHKNNTREHFTVTDEQGRYYLLAENGEYTMKVKGQPQGGQIFERQGNITIDKGMFREDVVV